MSLYPRTGLVWRRQRQEVLLGDPDRSRVRAPQAARERSAIVVTIDGRIEPADIGELCERLRLLVEGTHAEVVICDVARLVEPDVGAVDALARLQLTARRSGCQLWLERVCDELQEVLALTGLSDVVPALREVSPRVERAGRRGETSARYRGRS